jgi:hypothetical protein
MNHKGEYRMKTLIIGRIAKKTYHMCEQISFSWSLGIRTSADTLRYDDDSFYKGELKFSLSEREEKVLKETSEFHKLLVEDDFIQVGTSEYRVSKVKHGDDGKIYYYVDIEYEDEESKLEALKQIELRDAFLKGRKLKEEEIKVKDVVVSNNSLEPVVSWFEPIKRKNMK